MTFQSSNNSVCSRRSISTSTLQKQTMHRSQTPPRSERVKGGEDDNMSTTRHRHSGGDFLSLDLPDETWEGLPSSDTVSLTGSQRTSATKHTTASRHTTTAPKQVTPYQPSEESLNMSRKERAFVETLQRQWEGEENPPMSIFLYLQYARFSNFYAKDAIKSMKELDPRYTKLSMRKLEPVIQSQILFPLPGLLSKSGTEVVYMRPSRFYPRKTSTKFVLDNLAYVLLSMAERELPSSYGVCFIADMTDWTMENYSSEYWAELMKMLQGGIPVKVSSFLIVNPPGWFGTILKVNKSLFTPSFARKVKTIEDKELIHYLVKGFEAYLPTGFGGGRANKDDIVGDFITSRLTIERKSKRKPTKST